MEDPFRLPQAFRPDPPCDCPACGTPLTRTASTRQNPYSMAAFRCPKTDHETLCIVMYNADESRAATTIAVTVDGHTTVNAF